MPTVAVTFTALPEHVRTARFLAAAVARRAGVSDDLLYEVRLAVGEACARAVDLHLQSAPAVPVELRMSDDDGRFAVEVIDKVPVSPSGASAVQAVVPAQQGGGGREADRTDGAGNTVTAVGGAFDVVPSALGLALITGLADDVSVRGGESGSVLAMSWRLTNGSTPAAPAAQ